MFKSNTDKASLKISINCISKHFSWNITF